MTDDLVKQVRDNFIDPKTVPWSFTSQNILLYKLADRIEALTAQLEAMKEAHDDVEQYARRHCAEVEALTADVDRLRSLLAEADCRIVWEGHGLGNDFAERVEAALKGQQP